MFHLLYVMFLLTFWLTAIGGVIWVVCAAAMRIAGAWRRNWIYVAITLALLLGTVGWNMGGVLGALMGVGFALFWSNIPAFRNSFNAGGLKALAPDTDGSEHLLSSYSPLPKRLPSLGQPQDYRQAGVRLRYEPPRLAR